MKYYILAIVVFVLSSWALLHAESGDIDSDIASLTGANMVRMEKVVFQAKKQYCEITYRRYKKVGEAYTMVPGPSGRVVVRFENIPDNPFTEADESVTKYSQLINYIDGATLKAKLTQAVKIELGIN